MHIDEALLAEVMLATGAASKTAAVDAALRKVATKFRQRERWKHGLGMSAEEIGRSYDASIPLRMDAPTPSLVAEEAAPYKAKPHGRKRTR